MFLRSSTLISNALLKLAKNQVNAEQHPEIELLLLFTFSIHFIIQKQFDTFLKIRKCICIPKIDDSQMMIKMKNRPHGHDIDSPKSRHIIINISMISRYDDDDTCMY